MRVAAVGYGSFGSFVLSAVRELPDVQIVAVAGRNPEKVRAFAERMQIPRWTTDWQTLIADPEVDIVCVLTPPHAHAEIATAAAQNGKHLFLEKPLALSLQEADEIIAAVEQNGVKAVVNHIMRYHPLYEWLKGRINAGDLRCGGCDLRVSVWRRQHANDVNLRVSNEGLPAGRPTRNLHPLGKCPDFFGVTTGDGDNLDIGQFSDSAQNERAKRTVSDRCNPHRNHPVNRRRAKFGRVAPFFEPSQNFSSRTGAGDRYGLRSREVVGSKVR